MLDVKVGKMGLFDRLFRKTKKVEEIKQKFFVIKENDIERILNDEIIKHSKPFMEGFENYYSSLMDSIKRLEKIMEDIKSYDLSSIPDTQARQIAESSRKEFIESLSKMVRVFHESFGSTPLSVIDYYNKCSKSWNIANAETLRTYKVIKEFIPPAKDASKEFSKLYKHLEELGKFITKKNEEIENIKSALDAYEDLKVAKEDLENKKDKMKSIEEKIKSITSELEKKKKELEDLDQSDEAVMLRELVKEKTSLEYRERELASKVVEIISTIYRYLKKLLHELEEKDKKLIKKYMESPFDALLEDKNMKINYYLIQLKEKIEAGEIEPKNREKSIEMIDKMIKTNLLSNISNEYKEIEKKIAEINSKISQISLEKRRKELEDSIKEYESKLSEVEKEKERMLKKVEELEMIIEAIKDELKEKLTKVFGENVQVIFS